MLKKALYLTLGLSLFGAADAAQATPRTAIHVQAGVQNDPYLQGFAAARYDLDNLQRMVQQGSITADQAEQTMTVYRNTAQQRMTDSNYSVDEQFFYAGYYDGSL